MTEIALGFRPCDPGPKLELAPFSRDGIAFGTAFVTGTTAWQPLRFVGQEKWLDEAEVSAPWNKQGLTSWGDSSLREWVLLRALCELSELPLDRVVLGQQLQVRVRQTAPYAANFDGFRLAVIARTIP